MSSIGVAPVSAPRAARLAHAPRAVGIGGQAPQRRLDRLGAVVVDEEPGDAMGHRVRQGADPPGHHRPGRRHRLERRATRLVGARAHQDEDVERLEHGGQIAVAIAGQRTLFSSPRSATSDSSRDRASPLPTRRSRASG